MGIKDFHNYRSDIISLARIKNNIDMKLKFDINIGSTEHFRPSYITISYNDIHRKIENIFNIKDILIHTLPKRLIYRKASLNIKDLIKYGRDGRFRYTTIRRF